MPFCTVSPTVKLYYHLYRSVEHEPTHDEKPARLLFIMGLSASFVCWQPQVLSLLQYNSRMPHHGLLEICTLDNRGMGLSSSPFPANDDNYSTTIMARDCLAVLDHLGWPTCHIVGHSMGSMIALKLAALAPQRCSSMTAISSTGGGWQMIPTSLRAWQLVLKSLRMNGDMDHHELALTAHFTKEMLDEMEQEGDVGSRKRKVILLQEYSTMARCIGPNTEHGKKGQLRAVWKHRVTRSDVMTIRHARVPCLVVHGRHDIIAMPKWGQKLSEQLKCPLVMLEGAHFLTRDQAHAVNELIVGVVFGKAFHHPPHYQFVLNDSHLPGSYVEELDNTLRDLEGVPEGRAAGSGGQLPSSNGPHDSHNPVDMWQRVGNGAADCSTSLNGRKGNDSSRLKTMWSKLSSKRVGKISETS